MEINKINAMGKQCPIPVVLTGKAIAAMKDEGEVEVMVDNQTAVGNLQRLAERIGAGFSAEGQDKEFKVTIKVTKDSIAKAAPIGSGQDQSFTDGLAACGPKAERRDIVVFEKNVMGSGSDELGAILIKGFIYALSQLDKAPAACIFYNSGAKLTSEGSESLEDLKALAESGTDIMTCGTCVDFYGLKGKVAVGRTTNMYEIVETMDGADKIIKP